MKYSSAIDVYGLKNNDGNAGVEMSKPCVGIVIQARSGSTRLPRKVLMDMPNGECILGFILRRLSTCRLADKIIVATTENPNDTDIAAFCEGNGYQYFRGSEPDCLDRFYQTGKNFLLDIVIRITADCPLVVPEVVDEMTEYYLSNQNFIDYLTNRQYTNFPEGLDTEIFTMKMLKDAAINADSADEREHINYYFLRRDDQYRVRYFNHKFGHDYSRFKLSIDTIEDYKKIYSFFTEKGLPENFQLADLISLLSAEQKEKGT